MFLSDLGTAITIQLTNRDCVPSSKFKRSNRDSTKLDRDVADIRCAQARSVILAMVPAQARCGNA